MLFKKFILNALRIYKNFGYAITCRHATYTCNIECYESGPMVLLFVERIVLASLDTRKAETIRDHDWFCQCNS